MRANPATPEFPYRYFARRPGSKRGKVYCFETAEQRDYQAEKHVARGYNVEAFDALPLFEPGRAEAV